MAVTSAAMTYLFFLTWACLALSATTRSGHGGTKCDPLPDAGYRHERGDFADGLADKAAQPRCIGTVFSQTARQGTNEATICAASEHFEAHETALAQA